MEKPNTRKKVLTIIGNVIIYLFIALCIFVVTLTISGKKDADGATTFFGMQMRFVLTSSMEKCDATDVSGFEIEDIPTRSMVFIELVPDDKDAADRWYADLKVGDVLTFKYVYVTQETITHRITGIVEKPNGGYIINLEGDNKAYDSDTLMQTIDTSIENSLNHVIGKVVGQSYLLGLLVNLLRSPLGLVLIVILPSMVIIAIEIMKIIKLLTAGNEKKKKSEQEEQMRELDELKRRLAEFEAKEAERAASAAPSEAESTEAESAEASDKESQN